MSDPRYVDDPFDDEDNEYRMPKWRMANTHMQRRLLGTIGCKHWPMWSKELRSLFILAEKSTMPVGRIVPDWPLEWFDKCLTWYEKKKKAGEFPGLRGFMTVYLDRDAREEYKRGLVHSRQKPVDDEYR